MDKSSLITCLDNLAAAFNVSESRLSKMTDIYFQSMGEKVSDMQISKATQHLLETAERFPTISVFLEACRMYEPEGMLAHIPCAMCEGLGTITADWREYPKSTKYTYLFKCPNCENCTYDYPAWSDDFRRLGYKPNLKLITWDENDEYIVKGLVALGVESIAWKRAPEACRKKALERMNRKPKNNLFEKGNENETRLGKN